MVTGKTMRNSYDIIWLWVKRINVSVHVNSICLLVATYEAASVAFTLSHVMSGATGRWCSVPILNPGTTWGQ